MNVRSWDQSRRAEEMALTASYSQNQTYWLGALLVIQAIHQNEIELRSCSPQFLERLIVGIIVPRLCGHSTGKLYDNHACLDDWLTFKTVDAAIRPD